MFYTPEILCMRKKGKLARIWLAATLSERLFKESVTKRVILSINIAAACTEILAVVREGCGEKTVRFSLYLSSQLMYGAVRLFSYQTTVLQDSMFKMHLEISHVYDSSTRKKKNTTTDIIITESIDLPDPPPFSKVLKNITIRDDLHLLPEADLETMRAGRARIFDESLSFGALTYEQVNLLTDGDFRLQPLYDRDQEKLNVPTRYGAKDSNELLELPKVPQPIEQTDPDLNDDFRGIEDVVTDEAGKNLMKTPKKREAKTTNADTPTKRRRRNLGTELNELADERAVDQTRPPVDLPDVGPIDMPANMPDAQTIDPPGDFMDHQPIDLPADFTDHQVIDLPADFMNHQPIGQSADIPLDVPVVPPIDQPADVQANIPADPTIDREALPQSRLEETVYPENLQLESLAMETPRRPRTKRVRRRIDEHTSLSANEHKRRINNVLIDTVTKESLLIAPENIRRIPAISLLKKPSKNIHETSHRRSTAPRYFKWASQLYDNFKRSTVGPFHADDDVTMNLEAVRAADSRMQPISKEISTGLGLSGFESSSGHNKTAVEQTATRIESINPSVMPAIPEDDHQPPIEDVGLHEITNEPVMENTGEMATASISRQPESSDQTDPAAETDVANLPPTSDPDIGADAFLPLQLQTKTIVKKEKIRDIKPNSDPITDLCDSPSSMRSEVSLQSPWTKNHLLAVLEVHWHDEETLKLAQLLPIDTTTKLEAGTCFTLLLELSQELKVKLAQAIPYDDIYVTKVTVIPDSLGFQ